MVVEFLTFTVPADERDEWLRIEERHWSRFLEQQPGFISKEMWCSVDDHTQVHAVIRWNSMDEWKSVPADDMQQVIDAMGPHERAATCVAYDVLRRS